MLENKGLFGKFAGHIGMRFKKKMAFGNNA